MEDLARFRCRVADALQDISPRRLAYDENDFSLIRSPYEFIEFYAEDRRLFNTAVALPIARGLHNGSYRKSPVIRGGREYRMPYFVHPLMVCRKLIDIQLPLSREDEDILLASALCHDLIEDIPFENGGLEIMSEFHLSERVYSTVKKLSKRRDFTPEEEHAFFRTIAEDPLALIIKLSDRGNNVEDMYNMSAAKVHEYVDETRRLFFPMCDYGIDTYPELHAALEILRDKIISLTEAAEVLVDRYSRREDSLRRELQALQLENKLLHEKFMALREKAGGERDDR